MTIEERIKQVITDRELAEAVEWELMQVSKERAARRKKELEDDGYYL